jgi:hypothetical protein
MLHFALAVKRSDPDAYTLGSPSATKSQWDCLSTELKRKSAWIPT